MYLVWRTHGTKSSRVAASLDEALQAFHRSPKSAGSVLSVIKTETEIYLAQ